MAVASSPGFLLEVAALKTKLVQNERVQCESGCAIILALEGFAIWSTFPIVRDYLSGCSASSYHEARRIKNQFQSIDILQPPS